MRSVGLKQTAAIQEVYLFILLYDGCMDNIGRSAWLISKLHKIESHVFPSEYFQLYSLCRLTCRHAGRMVQSIQLQARVMFETLQTKLNGNRNIQNSLCNDVQNEAQLWDLLGLQLSYTIISCNVKGIQQTLQRRPEWWLLLSGSVLFGGPSIHHDKPLSWGIWGYFCNPVVGAFTPNVNGPYLDIWRFPKMRVPVNHPF